MDNKDTKFGDTLPFSEPSWYDSSKRSPYYNEHHIAYRKAMRDFVDNEIIPNVEDWEEAGEVPRSAFKRAAEVGMLPAMCGWPTDIEGIPPRPEGFDGFFIVIAFDELCRCASGGVVWGLTGGFGIGLPPVVHGNSIDESIKQRVAGECIRGEKRIALAISEPTAGSDVSAITTTAEEVGDHYVVNGLKKWITCGMFADYFTTAVRTGDEGMFGISLLLIPKTTKGVTVRPMDCMGVKGSGTAYVEFDNAKVPLEYLVGDVTVLLQNFVAERLGIAIQAARFARVCLTESVSYCKRRVAFGKKLEDQPVVRYKLATMMREVEVTQAYIESIVYRVNITDQEGGDWFGALMRSGAEAALCKVQATRTFEHCAREAAHLHGGNSYVKGNRIENLYRHVLSLAIPGGSEDVMVDSAARLALKGRL
jgi:alkylation response protein AidB-like acyl-CoA dehydrogenase